MQEIWGCLGRLRGYSILESHLTHHLLLEPLGIAKSLQALSSAYELPIPHVVVSLAPSPTSSVPCGCVRTQAMEYLSSCREADGVSSPEQFFQFVEAFQKASRNFAKRQLTWFRQEPLYHWIDASKQPEAIVDFIVKAYSDPGVIKAAEVKGTLIVDKKSTVDKKNKLRDYQPRKKTFATLNDCSQVLDWIRKTQRRKS
ncbi:hypothetical protein L7F22_005758 [Adiantum nelumboides]|nr:hypothetical protein [Adiantum nelumboides]